MFHRSEDIFEDTKKAKSNDEKSERKLEKELRRQIKQDEKNAKAAKKASLAIQKLQDEMESNESTTPSHGVLQRVVTIICLFFLGIIMVIVQRILQGHYFSTDLLSLPKSLFLYMFELDIFLISTYLYFSGKGRKTLFAGVLSIVGFLSLFVTYFCFA